MRGWRTLLVAMALMAGFVGAYRRILPVYRVDFRSELVMLGDLNGDKRWDNQDLALLKLFLEDPFSFPPGFAWQLDLNRNGLIDQEDLWLLKSLSEANSDPYLAESRAQARGGTFPRPREFYRYVPEGEHRSRPLWILPYAGAGMSQISWLKGLNPPGTGSSYSERLDAEIYAEAVRLDLALQKREPGLNALEQEYMVRKLNLSSELFKKGDRFALLLELMGLVEDAETLSAQGQPEISLKFLLFRDHLRELIASNLYMEFQAGKGSYSDVLNIINGYLKADLGLSYDLIRLGPPRNLTHLENYLQRGEWQYYKSSTRSEDFLELLRFAQNDARYLRAVSRTSRKHSDPAVQNHNLPMVLLFREALRIKGGDKKKAVGLLDEAIRIPFGWIKSIPRDRLPGALALDNFLLPGNKEDGADKSRHWNVFGGICLYQSPREALDLGLKREMNDLRADGFSAKGMNEFIRDMIANLNGMYHVMTVNPGLLLPGSGSPAQGRAEASLGQKSTE